MTKFQKWWIRDERQLTQLTVFLVIFERFSFSNLVKLTLAFHKLLNLKYMKSPLSKCESAACLYL